MRVIAVDAKGGDVLDWEVPATRVSLTRALNTSAVVEVTVPAWYHARTDANGHPILLKRGTILVVEEDNGRLTPALMTQDSLANDFQASGLGLSVLSKDAPWQSRAVSWTNKDALEAWQDIWAPIIASSGVPRLKVTIPGRAGVSVGKPGTTAWHNIQQQIQDARVFVNRKENRVVYWERMLNNRARDVYRLGGHRKVGELVEKSGPPGISDAATYKAVIEMDDSTLKAVHFWDWAGVGGGSWTRMTGPNLLDAARDWRRTKASLDRANNLYPTYVQRISDLEALLEERYPNSGPEPYELNPWSSRDLSTNLAEVRELGGFDWFETATFDDQDRLVPEIRAVKTAGAIQDGLLFELGVNIHTHPELSRGDIATHVTVLGSGEGSSTLQADRSWSHPRLARTYRTVSESDYGTQQLVDKAADRELAAARKGIDWRFTRLRITDSKAAPIERVNLGDQIDIRGDLSDGTDLEQRVRVLEITRSMDGSNTGKVIDVEVGTI